MVFSLITLRQSSKKIFIRQHCLVQKSAVDLDLSNNEVKINSELKNLSFFIKCDTCLLNCDILVRIIKQITKSYFVQKIILLLKLDAYIHI